MLFTLLHPGEAGWPLDKLCKSFHRINSSGMRYGGGFLCTVGVNAMGFYVRTNPVIDSPVLDKVCDPGGAENQLDCPPWLVFVDFL